MSDDFTVVSYKRSSYKANFGSKNKVDFIPYVEKSAQIKFGRSMADPSFYRPTTALVQEFIAAGRNLLPSAAGQYDFPADKEKGVNGQDDGRKVSMFDSPYDPDPADAETEFRNQANRIERKATKAKEKELAEQQEKERHEEIINAINKDAPASSGTSSSSK